MLQKYYIYKLKVDKCNIFYYSKTDDRKFYPIYVPHDEKVIKRFQRDENGPYQLVNGKKYYMNLQPGIYESHPEGLCDNTHLQYAGAVVFGTCIAQGLKELGGIYQELLL